VTTHNRIAGIEVDCSSEFADTACKVKLAGGSNNCDGTVLVGCGNTLRFFINNEGQYDYCNHMDCKDDGINEGDRVRRTWMEPEEEGDAAKEELLSSLLAVSGGVIADAASSSSSLGEGVKDITSSSLRGAKGSKRIL
jgi:hypothetical protein